MLNLALKEQFIDIKITNSVTKYDKQMLFLTMVHVHKKVPQTLPSILLGNGEIFPRGHVRILQSQKLILAGLFSH